MNRKFGPERILMLATWPHLVTRDNIERRAVSLRYSYQDDGNHHAIGRVIVT